MVDAIAWVSRRTGTKQDMSTEDGRSGSSRGKLGGIGKALVGASLSDSGGPLPQGGRVGEVALAGIVSSGFY